MKSEEMKHSSENPTAEMDPSADPAIQNKYCFWYMRRDHSKEKESYEDSIKPFGSFDTVGGFWGLYNRMIRPNDLPPSTEFHLFKDGIKPMWEDSANRDGGKTVIRLPKGLASQFWEDLILAVIGERFDVGNEVCGAVISTRSNEDVISLWNRNADNTEACHKIREIIKYILELPPFAKIEYRRHDMSIQSSEHGGSTTTSNASNTTNPRIGIWKPSSSRSSNPRSSSSVSVPSSSGGGMGPSSIGSSSNGPSRDRSGQGREYAPTRMKPDGVEWPRQNQNWSRDSSRRGPRTNSSSGTGSGRSGRYIQDHEDRVEDDGWEKVHR